MVPSRGLLRGSGPQYSSEAEPPGSCPSLHCALTSLQQEVQR